MLLAFSVAPVGRTTDPADPGGGGAGSVGAAVADAIRVVRESGLPHRTDAMFTTLEGDWTECMEVVRLAVEAVGRHGERVALVLKADVRTGAAAGRTGELQGKLDRLEAALAVPPPTPDIPDGS